MVEAGQSAITGYRRYGIYVVPEGGFYSDAAEWLGWDSVTGTEVPHPSVPGLPGRPEDLTATPRKYGFHGTIKPPFFLADGTQADGLHHALAAFCATRSPVQIPNLVVRRLGGFIAVVPDAPSVPLANLASATVDTLDDFRAPPSENELARRRKAGLSDRQEALLTRWGYPYVMDEFRFHLTLTGRLSSTEADAARDALAAYLDPVLPRPWTIDNLCLLGEAEDGRFHLLHRYTFAG